MRPLTKLQADAVYHRTMSAVDNRSEDDREVAYRALETRCRRAGYASVEQASRFGYIDKLMKLVDKNSVRD